MFVLIMNNEQKFKQSWNTLPWTSKTCDEENILNLVHWRKRDFRCGWLEVGYTIVSRNPSPLQPPNLSLHLESILGRLKIAWSPGSLTEVTRSIAGPGNQARLKMAFYLEFHKNEKNVDVSCKPYIWFYSKMGAPKSIW